MNEALRSEEEGKIEAEKLASLRDAALSIFTRALEDCSVPSAFQARISVSENGRRILHLEGDDDVDLTDAQRMLVISMGKGATPMLSCLIDTLRPLHDLIIEGVLVAPETPAVIPKGIRFFVGGHPLPNQASLDGARAALDLLRRYAVDKGAVGSTFCIFLLSGGASAMMELPLDLSISLDDLLSAYRTLVHSGASIAEINCVRKHMSAVKGGRLALAAGDLRCLTIAISDVPAGQLDALGSGPTLPDSSTVARCRSVLEQYNLLQQFPAAVERFFNSAALLETPKSRKPGSRFYALLSEENLGEAARRRAELLGFHVVVDRSCDDWDYKDAAEYLIARLRSLRDQLPRLCLVSYGEVTVQLDQSPGSGGRNQQLALYAATLLESKDHPTVILSAGSDGIDGNSPAAGALVDSGMFFNPEVCKAAAQALSGFDAYPLLSSLGADVITGRTGNNLRDLRLLLTA